MSHGKSVELSKKTKSCFLAIGAAEKQKRICILFAVCRVIKEKKLQAPRTTHKGKVQDFVQLRKFHTFSHRYFESAC
jgi:hypothetical protein